MATDLTQLNMTQLETLSGRDRRFIRSRLADRGVAPIGEGKKAFYPARPALEAIFGQGEDLDLSTERALLAREQWQAQALKNALAREEQVEVERVDEYLCVLVGAFTQRIRAIPVKAAPEVRATRSDAEAEALLTSFHDEALDELAEAGRRAADRLARNSSREAVAEIRRNARTDSAVAAAGDGERVGGPGAEAEPGKQRGAGAVEDGEG